MAHIKKIKREAFGTLQRDENGGACRHHFSGGMRARAAARARLALGAEAESLAASCVRHFSYSPTISWTDSLKVSLIFVL